MKSTIKLRARRIGNDQSGEMNVLLVPVILMTLFFIAAAAFGYWAFTSRQDYKNNADQKIVAAVSAARKDESIKKDQAFAEAEKNPLTLYQGPGTAGSVETLYPKTWSTYVHSMSSQPLDTYFAPRAVPSVQSPDSVFALRIQVLPQEYTSTIKQYEGPIKAKTVTANPFAFPKVPDVIGIRVDGQIKSGKKTNGSMIIMPLRDKTLEIYTESPEFIRDFNDIIIPNLTFSP